MIGIVRGNSAMWVILIRHACSCSRRQHGRVIGIVRGNSDEAAAERLRAGFDSGDADLLATYDALSAEHLTVYAGTCHISRVALK